MASLPCTYCRQPLPPERYNRPDLIACPTCRVPTRVDVFPAFFRPLQPGKSGEALKDEQSSCFFHPSKKAAVPCDQCGRFLCALCDVEMNGKHLCPVCVETGRVKGKIVNLERHRQLYDGIALRLAVFPIITVWFTIVTAPIALYFAIRHWNSPMSIVRRSKIRYVLAMLISGLQILAWGGMIFSCLYRK
ncbi:MAG TPA: hypothetical protein VLS90_09170 [Thermodesulfobacteriota bacterium]|nr:hypothetical protein [Thermodesulfobacteriota bacterium]